MSPLQYYSQHKEKLLQSANSLQQTRRALGWARLITITLAFIALWQLWPTGILIAITGFFFLIGIFLFLVTRDSNNNKKIENNKRLLGIIDTETRVLQHQFQELPHGTELKPANHDYANDLDIFGSSSLFQYLNRAQSEQGKQLLAHWLLHPATPNDILERQKAMIELSALPEWRHELQSFGMEDHITTGAEQSVNNWIEQPSRFLDRTHWKILRMLMPLVGISAITLYAMSLIPAGLFSLITLILFAGAFYTSKLIMPEYRQLNKIAAQVETISQSIQHIEQQSFRSDLLFKLQKNFSNGTEKASRALGKLKSILDRLDYRLNPIIFLPLNTYFAWDLQQAFALENWKRKNNNQIHHWFSSLAEFECLSSIANLHFNQPSFTLPVLSNEEGVFEAVDLGHPLIPQEKRVTSSFHTNGLAQISLITGSNMAGKSTFLRSIGVNTVLAMAGAPVCATSMTLSPTKVMSSMRISDNLEESTSTFYAELKKLKTIIEAVNRNEKLMILLDEILRGTNSADRHTGSSALIKQLIGQQAVALVATHDLQLASLEKEYPANIHNYHFDVQVAGEELFFDYKLKTGVCTSMNASVLMRKIGIQM